MEKEGWTPGKLLATSGMFWSSCAIHAAVELDVFTFLDTEGSLTGKALGRLCRGKARAMEPLLISMTAMGLLRKDEDVYTATDFARKHLSRNSGDYLGHIIMHHKNLVTGWSKLGKIVKNGKPHKSIPTSKVQRDSTRKAFLMGMFNIAMRQAPAVSHGIDLTGRARLLDLGGGPGTYAIFFCLQNPTLRATVFDLPSTRPYAEKTIKDFNLASRIEFREGDCVNAHLPQGHDIVWISQLLHSFGDDEAFRVLQRAVAALEPGGLLLIQEFFMDDDRRGPLHPALFGLNMLINTASGKVYTPGEISVMLEKLDMHRIKTLDLQLPNGCKVISAVK